MESQDFVDKEAVHFLTLLENVAIHAVALHKVVFVFLSIALQVGSCSDTKLQYASFWKNKGTCNTCFFFFVSNFFFFFNSDGLMTWIVWYIVG